MDWNGTWWGSGDESREDGWETSVNKKPNRGHLFLSGDILDMGETLALLQLLYCYCCC